MRQRWNLIHSVFLQSLQVLWIEDVQQHCPPSFSFEWLPYKSHKHASPHCSFYCCQAQACFYPTDYCYWSQQLWTKGQNTLFIGAGIWEGIFHYLQYHFLSLLFKYNLWQPCNLKVTSSRLFPVSGENVLILWDERGAYETYKLYKLSCCCGEIIHTRYSGLFP